MKNKGLEFGFTWIFALLVGGMLVFLAVFATTRLIKTERNVQDTEAGKSLGILLTPLETGLESGKATTIKFPSETKLFNRCKNIGVFGVQEIGVASSLELGGKEFEEEGIVFSKFYNKYLFSNGVEQGKELMAFVKPFEFPFKVADLIYVWEGNYCFVNPTGEIEEEIDAFNRAGSINLNVSSSVDGCFDSDIVVCFDRSGCDIDVSLSGKSVRKNKQTVYYDDGFGSSLIYAAIFAEPAIYECQVKRLMRRASELALLESAKSEYLESKGCGSGLVSGLVVFADKTRNIIDSSQLNQLAELAKQLDNENEQLACKLF